MRIFHPQTTLHGAERDNSFIVQDQAGVEIGQGWLHISANRDQPSKIQMLMDSHPAARDMLFGALFARAKFLGRQQRAGSVRLVGSCNPSDIDMLAYYKAAGFDDTDGEELFQWDLMPQHRPFYAPVGTNIMPTYLETYSDMHALLARANYWSGQHHEIEWLMEAAELPYFIACGVYSGGECIGEAMATGSDGEAVLEMLYTMPAWRRHHVATALMLHIKEQLSKRGAVNMRVQASRSNAPAMGILENLRFKWLYTLQIYPSIDL